MLVSIVRADNDGIRLIMYLSMRATELIVDRDMTWIVWIVPGANLHEVSKESGALAGACQQACMYSFEHQWGKVNMPTTALQFALGQALSQRRE